LNHSVRARLDGTLAIDARLSCRAPVSARSAVLWVPHEVDLAAVKHVRVAIAEAGVADISTSSELACRGGVGPVQTSVPARPAVHQVGFEIVVAIAPARARIALTNAIGAHLSGSARLPALTTIQAVPFQVDFTTVDGVVVAIGPRLTALAIVALSLLAAPIRIRPSGGEACREWRASVVARAAVGVVAHQVHALRATQHFVRLATDALPAGTDLIVRALVAAGAAVLRARNRRLAAVLDHAVAIGVEATRIAHHRAAAADADPTGAQVGHPPLVVRTLISTRSAVVGVGVEVDVAEVFRRRAGCIRLRARAARAHGYVVESSSIGMGGGGARVVRRGEDAGPRVRA